MLRLDAPSVMRARTLEHELEHRLARALRHLAGRAQGLAHRLDALAEPQAAVPDAVLAERVRSKLGPLYKQLDVPRMNVMASGGVVTLHGVVATDRERTTAEQFVARVPGVKGVRSHLFVGLVPGETRPSEGRHPGRSRARHELLGVVRALDVGDDEDVERLTRAVLGTLFELLPDQERRHLLSHLPEDARGLISLPRRIGLPPRPRTAAALFADVADACGRSVGTAEQATRAVFATLRELVPEESAHVEAVLPEELKSLWEAPEQV